MEGRAPLDKVRKNIGKIIDILSAIGMGVTFILMIVTAADTILRKAFSVALLGSLEITEMGMVILIFFGIASNQVSKGHVSVDMFIDLFPRKLRHLSDTIVLSIEVIVMGLMTYAAFQQSLSYFDKSLTTDVLHIPVWPFAILMSLGLFLFTVMLLLDAIISAVSINKRDLTDESQSLSENPT